MAGSKEVQTPKEEPVIPGWIGPDTRSFHRRHRPWYKRRDVRRVIYIVLAVLVAIGTAIALLMAGRGSQVVQ